MVFENRSGPSRRIGRIGCIQQDWDLTVYDRNELTAAALNDNWHFIAIHLDPTVIERLSRARPKRGPFVIVVFETHESWAYNLAQSLQGRDSNDRGQRRSDFGARRDTLASPGAGVPRSASPLIVQTTSSTLGIDVFCTAFSVMRSIFRCVKSHPGASFLNLNCGMTYDHT